MSSMGSSHISLMHLICLIICGGKSECCYGKQVGNVIYTLVERSNTTMAYHCVYDCIYKEKNVEDLRVCFRSGHLPVTCVKENCISLAIVNSKVTLFNL